MVLMLLLIIIMTIFFLVYVDEEPRHFIISIISSSILNFKKPKCGDIRICTDVKTLRNIYIPLKDRFLHTLILGPTGSGKTSLLLFPMLNQDIKNGYGITVIEPKGDLAEKVFATSQLNGRECLYFNPIHESCPKFNPLFGKEEDVIETMVLCFRMILNESPDFFKDTTEKALRYAIKAQKRVKTNSTLIDLDNFLSNNGGYGEQIIVALTEINKKEKDLTIRNENLTIIQYFNTEYFIDNSQTWQYTSSLRTQLTRLNDNRYLRRVLNPKNGQSDIDFNTVIEEGKVLAITTAQGVLNQTLSRLLGLFIILNLQSAVFKRTGSEETRIPHFLYIDEFQEYANPSFGIMLTQGRSYRVASILATQNRQLISGDGSREGIVFLDLVLANTRNIMLFPDLPPEDNKYFSEKFGEKRVYKKSMTKSSDATTLLGYSSYSKSLGEAKEPIISPTSIAQRKFKEITYKIMENNSAKTASYGRVEFISKIELDEINRVVEENSILYKNGLNPSKLRDKQGKLKIPIKTIISKMEFKDSII